MNTATTRIGARMYGVEIDVSGIKYTWEGLAMSNAEAVIEARAWFEETYGVVPDHCVSMGLLDSMTPELVGR